MFKRKIYDEMKKWKEEWGGKYALLIEGARRVGKSTVVEEFARNEYKSYILIDFVEAPKEVRELFDDLHDLDYIFLRLQSIYNVFLERRQSVIVFDEVQNCPKARQAIKYLVKDGRYDYIETGSLISIKKNVRDIVIPSEEKKLQMNPMDYEEFLMATGKEARYSFLGESYEKGYAAGNDGHRRQMRDFRLYMLVGGMPQAVSEYVSTNNLKKTDEVKREILNLYEQDFKKVDPSGRLSAIFAAIPSQLNSHSTKFRVKKATGAKGVKEETILTLAAELSDSKVASIAYHVNDPAADLAAHRDIGRFKIYLCDTGLFVTLCFRNKDYTENIIYEKLLSDKLPTNMGAVYENMVAQMITAGGGQLFYHTFPSETGHRSYEIDFIIPDKNKICPIEVKSSKYRTHTSLDKFGEKYGDRISKKYIIDTKDMHKDGDILCYPTYMTDFLV